MIEETFEAKVNRVRLMAEDDSGTWDLSRNDTSALHAVLKDYDDKREALAASDAALRASDKRGAEILERGARLLREQEDKTAAAEARADAPRRPSRPIRKRRLQVIADPTDPPENAYDAARHYCSMMTAYHSVEHQKRLKQRGMYEVAKMHRLLGEIFALGGKRLDLLQAADRVLRRVRKKDTK